MALKWQLPQGVVLGVLNLAAMLEHADEALVPAVYAEMGLVFGVGPTALGSLTFVRALVQALASPLSAYLSTRYNRAYVISMGCVVWGTATALVGLSTAYWQAILSRAANGVGLAVVVPALQSLVADFHKEEDRGKAFGWMHGAGQIGTVAGGIFATVMGPHTVMGFGGWRVAFIVVALLSWLVGAAVSLIVNDPSHSQQSYDRLGVTPELVVDTVEQKKQQTSTYQEIWDGTKSVLSIRTFQVIVAQGIVGSTPWNAMVFLTLWMELLGFSHGLSAFLVALLSLGNAGGSIFGGWLGDHAAYHFPNSGRIMCSQISAGIGIPLAALLLLGLPKDSGAAWVYAIVLFSMGFLISWNSPATNWPIFSEIVPDQLRTTVYALDMALEKSLAAAGAPLVGILAEHAFSFHKVEKDKDGTVSKDLVNANALGHGLYFCIAVPFLLCIIVITLLYRTYPRDRDQVRTMSTSEEDGKALQMEAISRQALRDWDETWDALLEEAAEDDTFTDRSAFISSSTRAAGAV